MKTLKLVTLVICAGWMVQDGFAQVTVHYWNFNTIDTLSNGDWVSPIPATTGSGSLTHEFVGVKPFTGTTVNAEGSDPPGSAFCPQGGTALVNNGKNLTLSLPTTGYQNLIFSYATRRTSTGFDTQEILYSLDGTTFVSDTVMTNILVGSFEPTPRVVNFSDISGANNNPNFKIKIIVNGASGSTGNNRFDNIKIQGFLPTLNDGDGTATLMNNAGTFSGSTIFSRNTGGQTVIVTVTGVPAGNLDRVRLTVPSDWSGFSASNVTLGGAFAGNTPVVVGNQITINSAALGTSPGTIQIGGLTSPNPVGPLNDGNDVWTVETATSGGTLTAIASSPRSHTIIPIQNMRTGGADGLGNSDLAGNTSALTGQVVAIRGVATVGHGILNTTIFTSFFIQESGYGMQIFRSGSPVVTWVPGDIVVVKGTVTNFNGGMEVIPTSGSSPDFYNLGPGTLPTPLVLPNAAAVNEANEGKLVQLNNVTYDSAGQTFIASAANRGRNNYRTSPTDTGSIWLHAVNPIVNRVIPASGNIVGVIYQRNDHTGGGQPARKIAPRGLADLGLNPADGTGTATITPSTRFYNQAAVAETLTVTGDGTYTLEGVRVTVPDAWAWNGTSFALSGAGFSGATPSVSGTGTSGDPWIITVTGAAVTNINTGTIRIFNLSTPATVGLTTFLTATRGSAGTFTAIAASPTVNIISLYEAVASGNWSNAGTWAGGLVPGPSDDVYLTTLGVQVTIDLGSAACNNLTMRGFGSDTTGGGTGPVLKFASSGNPQLTINGSLAISGGGGGGGGNRGGRPQLTSNGNPNAVLIVKRNISTTSSNTVANGNAGLNMNEGTLKMIGASTDSLKMGAGARLGNLEIGDGTSAKTVYWVQTGTAPALLRIISLRVKSNATFWIGNEASDVVGNIGSTEPGVPKLTGGITVDSGGSLLVQNFLSGVYVGKIYIDAGGITNNGVLDLTISHHDANLGFCYYDVYFGGFTGASAANQLIAGSNVGEFANIVIGPTDTLTLQQDILIPLDFIATLNGRLVETPGNTIIGKVEATRTVPQATTETFGNIGLEINAAGAAPGATVVHRVTGVPSVGGGNESIRRYFDIAPAVNTGLNATLRYFYDNSELAGQNPLTLQLWKSVDGGMTWSAQGGTVDTALRRVEVSGVNDFSRWTASDANNPLVGGGTVTINVPVALHWNILSLPVANPTDGDSVRQVYTNSSFPYGFAFSAGYVQRFVMQNGPGYWIKSTTTYVEDIIGTPISNLTIPVVGLWNMIGSRTTATDTGCVIWGGGAYRTSAFFAYNAGYVIVTSLAPGNGFWVKSGAAGTMTLQNCPSAKPAATPAGRSIGELNTLTIRDANGGSQTLYFGADANGEIPVDMYAMPPVPPEGAFDARFASAEGGLMVQTHPVEVNEAIEMPIVIRSSAYPLTVTWRVNGIGTSYELRAGEDVVQTLRGEGTMRIGNEAVNRLSVRVTGSSALPKEYALWQNYPNPFNPATTIRFALPVESKVSAEIYNILGQRVATLVNEVLPAGYHTMEWNGTGSAGQAMGSGVYFLRVAAKGTNGKDFTDVKKLMLVK